MGVGMGRSSRARAHAASTANREAGIIETAEHGAPSSRRWQLWIVVAVAGLLAGGGIAGTVATARDVARHDAEKSRQAAQLSSVEVASTLRLALQREEDLAVSASGFFLENPAPTNSEFVAWAETVRGFDRYPELLGWGEVVIVSAADLSAYAARATAAPAGVVSGPFAVTPPGDRPFYCLFLVGQSRNPGPGAPAGYDYCAGTAGEPILAARDSGHSSYQFINTGSFVTLAAQVPIYRGGITPTTIEGRRQAFIGWVGLGFDPTIMLAQALRDHPVTAVSLRFQDGASIAEFSSGPVRPDAQIIATDLGNGWTVETFAAVRGSGLFEDR
ncbi:MAG: diguanylate cyclase, partial [Ilumatobacteraceae bacterium]|nr:diguanylate cyclase [Ilumatobacteraceae bacterium]